MDESLADWGPDGGGLQFDCQTGLGCRLLRITAEDKYEQQPLWHEDCLLVAHVRLDNRADLCRDLGLADHVSLPDSVLIMAAWRRYGIDCVGHLQGDWVFALWDRTASRLVLARCATGTAGLFWCRQNGSLLFATGIKGLLAHPDLVPVLNKQHLVCLLTATEDPEDDSTAFENVHLLEPGHLLLAGRGGFERRRWWRPENLAPLRLPSSAQYYEAFRELYGTVVGQYLRVGEGGIAATLSGGLDSASVVALAAARLTQPLKAYVHAPFYEPAATVRRIGNELPQAMRLAEHVGNVEILPIYSPDTSLMTGIEHGLRVNAAPAHGACHEYWLLDILSKARAGGARVLLTGQGGNSTISYGGSGSLLPLLFNAKLPSLLAALRADHSGLWRAVKLRLIKPVVMPVRDRLRQGHPRNSSILNPALVHLLRSWQPPARPFPLMTAFRLGTQGAGRGRARWMASGAAHGLDVRDPTRDRRIVEFCWRLPDDVFWASGRQRGLIRVGMSGYLPAEIRDEARKGLQSSDIMARVRAQSSEIGGAINAIAGSATAADYVNASTMEKILEGIVSGGNDAGGNSMPCIAEAHTLARALSVGYFLVSQPQ